MSEPVNLKEQDIISMKEKKKSMKINIIRKKAEIKKMENEILEMYRDFFHLDDEITNLESEVE